MEVKEVDPFKVNVDEMNERRENLNLGELEASVAEQGIIQPPIVRKRNGDAEVPYSVVVGQRRTMAAQGAGLDRMPVIVMDWDDKKALDASVTENIEAFREEVSPADRAMAIRKRLDMGDVEDQSQLAEKWGVHRRDISRWLERTRDEWGGTIVDPDVLETEDVDDIVHERVEKMSDDTLADIRQAVGGGESGEELVKKVAEHDLAHEDVKELTKKIDRGQDVDRALTGVIEEKHNVGDIRVQARVTFTGASASALTNFAEDRGMSEKEVVRAAIDDFLSREGYL